LDLLNYLSRYLYQ